MKRLLCAVSFVALSTAAHAGYATGMVGDQSFGITTFDDPPAMNDGADMPMPMLPIPNGAAPQAPNAYSTEEQVARRPPVRATPYAVQMLCRMKTGAMTFAWYRDFVVNVADGVHWSKTNNGNDTTTIRPNGYGTLSLSFNNANGNASTWLGSKLVDTGHCNQL